jgi:hypothetical protein
MWALGFRLWALPGTRSLRAEARGSSAAMPLTRDESLRAVPVSPSVFARREVGRRSNPFDFRGDYRVIRSTVRAGIHRLGLFARHGSPGTKSPRESLRPTSGFALRSASSEVGASPALPAQVIGAVLWIGKATCTSEAQALKDAFTTRAVRGSTDAIP